MPVFSDPRYHYKILRKEHVMKCCGDLERDYLPCDECGKPIHVGEICLKSSGYPYFYHEDCLLNKEPLLGLLPYKECITNKKPRTKELAKKE